MVKCGKILALCTMQNIFQNIGVVYCRREGTREISEKLLALKIIVNPACKKLFSRRKQNEFWYQKNLKKLYPSTKLELKFVETILRSFANLESLITRYRPTNRNQNQIEGASGKTRRGADPRKGTRRKTIRKRANKTKVRTFFYLYRFCSGSYLELDCSGASKVNSVKG